MSRQKKTIRKELRLTEDELFKCQQLVKRLGYTDMFSTTLIKLALKLYEHPEFDALFKDEHLLESTLFQHDPSVVRYKEVLKDILGNAVDENIGKIIHLATLLKEENN